MQARSCLLFGLLQLCATVAYQEVHQSVLVNADAAKPATKPESKGNANGNENANENDNENAPVERNPNKNRDVHYPKTLEVRLSSAPSFAANEPIRVNVELFNPGPGNVKFLSYFLPSENNLNDRLFNVTLNGNPVAYIGPILKRRTPADADYIKLKQGESARGSVDLARYFDFSLTGEYTITYDVASWQLFDENGPQSGKVEGLASEPLVVSVTARPAVPPALLSTEGMTEIKTDAGRYWFSSCSATQQSQITAAVNQAWAYVSGGNIPVAYTNRFLTWFKEYSATHQTLIKNHYISIANAMNSVVFDCNCFGSEYAHVYPASPYRIYLCNAFWPAPISGTDSKAGTIIHELSHFDIVANTNDYAYGHAACKALTGAYARWNADSHEYYAENTPYLS